MLPKEQNCSTQGLFLHLRLKSLFYFEVERVKHISDILKSQVLNMRAINKSCFALGMLKMLIVSEEAVYLEISSLFHQYVNHTCVFCYRFL